MNNTDVQEDNTSQNQYTSCILSSTTWAECRNGVREDEAVTAHAETWGLSGDHCFDYVRFRRDIIGVVRGAGHLMLRY